nr:restriction endonuclease subunit S [Collinsella aerofaciens]
MRNETLQLWTACHYPSELRHSWSRQCPVLQIILSPLFQIQVKDHATGTTAKGIKAAVLKELFLPIPPLAEQRRIVERVNELMPLVEEYGELEDAREELDAALPGRLRKSVLQLAVQGGLVPQDPADEPAGVLLERIRGSAGSSWPRGR